MPLRPITDVQEAIIRMGRREFQKVFYFTVLRDAFSSPNPESCLRLVSALLAELDDEWMTGKVYLNINT